MQQMMKRAPKMGIKVAQTVMVELSNDRTETYVKGVRDSEEPQVQLVCVIRPTHRDDRYPETALAHTRALAQTTTSGPPLGS